MHDTPHWNLFIDTGGTFTDCMAIDPEGHVHREKILSNSAIRGKVTGKLSSNQLQTDLDPSLPKNFFSGYTLFFLDKKKYSYKITGSESGGILTLEKAPEPDHSGPAYIEIKSNEEAPVLAARIITKTTADEPFPPLRLRLSTTKGTNALLERNGAKTLFLITKGFKDLLKIKNQQRPDLFSLNIRKSLPYYSEIFEIPERVDAKGNILAEFDPQSLTDEIKSKLGRFESIGVCLMNSTVNQVHEKKLKDLLSGLNTEFITISSDLSREIKIVPRAVTTDVNSYLAPVINCYLNRISESLGNRSFRVMISNGSLAEASHYKPKDGLLSGPAGGVTGAASIGRRLGFSKIISFDMGGTSTDVALYDNQIPYVYEHSVGDATLTSPAVDIETVAAGGGSVCGFDGVSLTVGPESAGADPGPACYGRGGPLTITDVNLLSERLHTSNFHISISINDAEKRFNEIIREIHQKQTEKPTREQILEGFLDIANERMAQAIQKISTQKGLDPAEYKLIAFGGAGAQHALAIAEKLGISKVIVPSDAGLLSAYGLQQAKLQHIATRQILQPLKQVEDSIKSILSELQMEAESNLKQQGVKQEDIFVDRQVLFLRFKGQDHSIEIDWKGPESIPDLFKMEYKKQYGHWIDNRDIELETLRIIVKEKSLNQRPFSTHFKKGNPDSQVNQNNPEKSGKPDLHDKSEKFPVYSSAAIESGRSLNGPALILEPFSTTVIEPGWTGTLMDDKSWLITRITNFDITEHRTVQRNETVNLQLYTNRFRSVADQMGEMLQRTALSVNIKERLDFSCALLDRDGYLVVNAPHIPVHLGALGTCVRTILKRMEMVEGDIVITNHPKFGGSHLPDVTVITPVYDDGQRIGFCVSRAHHAEIGGSRPGSMPPDALTLAEEGVVISPMYLAKSGDFDWKAVKNLLEKGRMPSRSPELNLADIQAAVAANHRGSEELKNLAAQFGADEISLYMEKLKSYAAKRMRVTLKELKDGRYQAEERLDNGAQLSVLCTVDGDSMEIDFTGTSRVQPDNLNANPSIVTSVIIYVLRLLVDIPLPLNDGLLDPVSIVLPRCMLNPGFPDDPRDCPAVVGGNIETSQRLVDAFLKAFGLAACSYGSMNNVLFGNNSFGYYETIAGGTGAGDGFHGADAVHQHMTNTRATDPEVLENRYPVRLDRYEIRRESGGKGKWHGGNGVTREMTFLEPVILSVLTQHRIELPYGLNGGSPGETGSQWIIRSNGDSEKLKWRDGAHLEKGDRFIMKTPGGGGFGSL